MITLEKGQKRIIVYCLLSKKYNWRSLKVLEIRVGYTLSKIEIQKILARLGTKERNGYYRLPEWKKRMYRVLIRFKLY